MIKNSFKQLLRQPAKCLIFFLLIAASTALVVVGLVLAIESWQRIRTVEETYATIGTIEQEPIGTEETVLNYSCSTTLNTYVREENVYAPYIPPETLVFPDANYVLPPEKRAYFISYMPGLNPYGPRNLDRHILEFTPLTDCLDGGPVEVEVTKVISSDISGASISARGDCQDRAMSVGDTFTLCQHGWYEFPLKVGEKYVTNVSLQWLCKKHNVVEYIPYKGTHTSQCDMEGNPIPSTAFPYDTSVYKNVSYNSAKIRHVDEVFYEPGHMGEMYYKWATYYQEMEDRLFSVLGTNGLELLPSWHDKTVTLASGRAITQEEFDTGAAVCMIPKELATQNMLHEGDKITLPLMCAYYGDLKREADGIPMETSLLDADGNFYEPFWEQEYEIAGTYTGWYGSIDFAENMFVIPTKSIGASWENNITYFTPMTKATASFQIPNGSIQEFDAALREAVPEAAGLTITYDDRGYSQVMKSLQNSRDMALLLLVAGILSALAIVALLLYFFVARERKRTAVERSLGLSRRQCRVSLMAGLLSMTLLAAGLGSACGGAALGKLNEGAQAPPKTLEELVDEEYLYSKEYSFWALNLPSAEAADIEAHAPEGVYLAVPGAVLGLVMLAGLLVLERSIRTEPIYLLSAKEDK